MFSFSKEWVKGTNVSAFIEISEPKEFNQTMFFFELPRIFLKFIESFKFTAKIVSDKFISFFVNSFNLKKELLDELEDFFISRTIELGKICFIFLSNKKLFTNLFFMLFPIIIIGFSLSASFLDIKLFPSNILKILEVNYKGINVLEDQSLREGIKAFSDWPTIPQLYIKKEFVGGCDIIKEMYENGELKKVFEDKGINFKK